MASNREIHLEKRSAIFSQCKAGLTIFKAVTKLNNSVRVVSFTLRRLADIDSFVERPRQCRSKKLSPERRRADGSSQQALSP